MCDRNPNGTYKTGHKGIVGIANNKWKGDKVGYFSKHTWIYLHYGKANRCEFNFNHINKKYNWCNISGKYKRDVNDYIQLCISCHRFMDKGNFCSKGHKFTKGGNTYIRKNGWRVCKICQKIRHKNYLKKKREVFHL